MSTRDDLASLIELGAVTGHTFEQIADAILKAGWRPPSDVSVSGFTRQELYQLATSVSRTRQVLARNAESLPAHQETLKRHWEKKSDLCGDLARRLRLLAEEAGEE